MVPEFIQHDMTPENLARATASFCRSLQKAQQMRRISLQIKAMLTAICDPSEAASMIAAELGLRKN